jgi:hypothetical protein
MTPRVSPIILFPPSRDAAGAVVRRYGEGEGMAVPIIPAMCDAADDRVRLRVSRVLTRRAA